MTIQDDLVICGENIAGINKRFYKHTLEISEYKNFLREMLNINNSYIDLVKEISLTNNFDVQRMNKRLIVCEIDAWRIYIGFKGQYFGIKDFILRWKHMFLKNSDYSIKKRQITIILKEIKDKGNILEPKEILEKYREIGKIYDELSQERIIKDFTLFWIAIGVIIAFFTYLKMT